MLITSHCEMWTLFFIFNCYPLFNASVFYWWWQNLLPFHIKSWACLEIKILRNWIYVFWVICRNCQCDTRSKETHLQQDCRSYPFNMCYMHNQCVSRHMAAQFWLLIWKSHTYKSMILLIWFSVSHKRKQVVCWIMRDTAKGWRVFFGHQRNNVLMYSRASAICIDSPFIQSLQSLYSSSSILMTDTVF